MKILISTNILPTEKLTEIKKFLAPLQGTGVGVEVFPMFHMEGFEEELQECMETFQELPISFHSQYYQAEYNADKGSELYNKTMEYFEKTLSYAKKLHSSYIVFHHSNFPVTGKNKETLYQNAEEMLDTLNKVGEEAGVPLVIENAGVKSIDTMLLDQKEFIETCKKHDNKVLIDIGHANANGWNLKQVMEELKDKIVSYHIHNNDGEGDLHQRIFQGTLDFNQFLEWYNQLTPEADLVIEYSGEYREAVEEVVEDIIYLQKTLKK